MFKLPTSRSLVAIILLLLFFAFLIAILFVTNLSLSVWQQLQEQPNWLILTYSLLVIFMALLFGRIIWHFLWPKKIKRKNKSVLNNIEATTQRLEDVSQRLLNKKAVAKEQDKENQANKENNSDSAFEQWEKDLASSPELIAIQAELNQYEQRKSQQTIYIALFGDISSGKSSVVKALTGSLLTDRFLSTEQTESFSQAEGFLPTEGSSQAEGSQSENSQHSKDDGRAIETSVVGGTTQEITHYHWSIKNNNIEYPVILTDMPGVNEQFAKFDLLATEEVQRAHIVLYLCDGDMTASQFNEFKTLVLLQKPCLVALNKADRYSKNELQLITDRIQQRINDIDTEQQINVFTIMAGGMREFIRVTPDGVEQRVERALIPDVDSLYRQLLKMMQIYSIEQLEQLREKSVSQMVNNKLDEVESDFQRFQSQQMVSSYTKKAVVASMATISPGTDILVQGYLGIQMIKDLCKIYDVPATDIDANKLIELIQSRMDKTLPLLLAIAGNGLKAFPGVGTVSGGLMHAVAYGMIFDTLGHSVARTLEVTGELSSVLISDLYKEKLSENIESRTTSFIKLVFKIRNGDR